MIVALLLLAIDWLDKTSIIALVSVYLIGKLLSILRSHRLELHYSKSNSLFKEFVAKTEIARMKFTHHIFAPTAAF